MQAEDVPTITITKAPGAEQPGFLPSSSSSPTTTTAAALPANDDDDKGALAPVSAPTCRPQPYDGLLMPGEADGPVMGPLRRHRSRKSTVERAADVGQHGWRDVAAIEDGDEDDIIVRARRRRVGLVEAEITPAVGAASGAEENPPAAAAAAATATTTLVLAAVAVALAWIVVARRWTVRTE